jgi:hypothetical protein
VPGSPDGEALEQLVREHAALRRVATLVARQPSPDEVFAVVTEEAGRLLGARMTALLRVESPQYGVIAAGWSDGPDRVPVGSRAPLDGTGLLGRILRTRRPVRLEDFDEVGGAVAEQMRRIGVRSGVAGPVLFGGDIWGALSAAWPTGMPMPAGAEDRRECFGRRRARRPAGPRHGHRWHAHGRQSTGRRYPHPRRDPAYGRRRLGRYASAEWGIPDDACLAEPRRD